MKNVQFGVANNFNVYTVRFASSKTFSGDIPLAREFPPHKRIMNFTKVRTYFPSIVHAHLRMSEKWPPGIACILVALMPPMCLMRLDPIISFAGGDGGVGVLQGVLQGSSRGIG